MKGASKMNIEKTAQQNDDNREAYVIYYGAEVDENESMITEDIDTFLDDFNTKTIIVATKWWAYAIIIVGVTFFAFLFSMIWLGVVTLAQ